MSKHTTRKAAPTKKPTRKKTKAKPFTVQLGWSGLVGVFVVTLCLFLWMFFLGVWAGQTILFPSSGVKKTAVAKDVRAVLPFGELPKVLPRARKKAVPRSKQ
ncbi:MAG: hypothetical protein CSA33_02965 [Desulfobulbus propionicus]|nr:MAG: hypothetical protein CSA33_02965 [Desulfobulbus propionicus]